MSEEKDQEEVIHIESDPGIGCGGIICCIAVCVTVYECFSLYLESI